MKQIFLICLSQFGFLVFGQQFTPRYELINLGKTVNTFYHEAAPVISPDGKTLYYFINNHPENTYGKEGSQDIWVTKKDDKGEWSVPKRLGSPLNQNRSNQVFNVMPDGSLFVMGGRGKNDKGFSLVSPGGSWQELKVKDFEQMEKGRFYGATISTDAKHMVLYFSEVEHSIRSDLYISHAQADGSWTRPEKLKLSTALDEYGPFIGPDNKTLYFASDRSDPHKQGGSDIYKSERLDDTWNNWAPPVNLGRPINTAAGDAYFSMDAAGDIYTSRANSRIDGGNLNIFVLVRKDIKITLNGTILNEKTQQPIAANAVVSIKDQKPIDIKVPAAGKFSTLIPETNLYTVSASAEGFFPKELTFDLPPIGNDTTVTAELQLTPVAKKLILTGTVFDKKTNQPVSSSIDVAIKPDQKISLKLNAPGGKYQQEIQRMGWYMMTAGAEGYMLANDSIEIVSDEVTPIVKDIYLQPIEVGVTVRLKNIYFDFNKTTLKPESYVELNKLVDALERNPKVEIEIAGHTDAVGTDESNLTLSQGRSQAVVDYLISQGIATERLVAHGYGEGKPIDTNDTDEGRANNRRVEFTITKK